MVVKITFPGTDEYGNVSVNKEGFPVFMFGRKEIPQQKVFAGFIVTVAISTIVYFIIRYVTIDRFLAPTKSTK